MKRITILASGSGTNAENIIRYFAGNPLINVNLVITNNPNAGVIERARKAGIVHHVFTKKDFQQPGGLMQLLEESKTDFIVLAGFLLLVPHELINRYAGRIINIHPALLPLHGGKGFYGNAVHEAVIRSGAVMSGITIHHVNEHFDEGEIIFQAACHVSKSDTPETLAQKIHELEYRYFPVVIEKLLKSELSIAPSSTGK